MGVNPSVAVFTNAKAVFHGVKSWPAPANMMANGRFTFTNLEYHRLAYAADSAFLPASSKHFSPFPLLHYASFRQTPDRGAAKGMAGAG